MKLPAFPLVTCSPCRGASQGSRRPRRRSGVPISDPLRPTLVRLTTGRRAEERLVPPSPRWGGYHCHLAGPDWLGRAGHRARAAGLVRHGLRHTALTWMAEHGGVPADMAHTRGVAWGEHHPDLFVGTERFFRTNYIAHLTDHWIRRWKGWKRSCALVPRSPMSAAGTARRR